ncbi:MAG TPA: MFS transporter [Bacteroidota bacterium]|nr:MFS transporter [Bacteroidota bacterium]
MPARTSSDDPYAALRFPEYRNLIIASFLFTVALLIQEVALGYELYTITRDPLALGFTGLAEAIPFIGLSLYGGHIADRQSKRKIILWGVGIITLGSFVLQLVARQDAQVHFPIPVLVGVIYGMVFLIGLCRAFQSPAAMSLRAFLVPIEVYTNAATWSSSAWQAGSIVGPTAGGFLFAWIGFPNTLLAVVGLLIVSLALFSRIRGRKEVFEPATEKLIESVKEGLNFVWNTKPILYAISLDLFSVLFGGVVAILPIYAQDILKVGSEGLGILRAAPSAGAMITLIILSRISPMDHAWRNLLASVAAFGVAILVFAVSPWMTLSVIALFFSGAFDSVSVVIRQTLLQILTPDSMRGRVMAVNGIFVSSSNELGAFESGTAARIMGVVPSAVFGGIMTLATVAWMGWRARGMSESYDIQHRRRNK